MCQLVESIMVVNREPKNLTYHNWRMNNAISNYYGKTAREDLNTITIIPDDLSDDVHKCRVVYSKLGIEKIEFVPYKRRVINSLKVVYDNDIDYTYKYTNRDHLNKLYEQRMNCDDIIIVKKNNVTDAFSSNLVFYNEKKWFTPSTPLLKGTKRQYYLENGIIKEKKIKPDDIKQYTKVSLINAMIDLEEIVVNVDSILF